MRLLKYHPHNSVLFVTFSMEEGLFFLANKLCDLIIKSCLARAQYNHPVRICAFHVAANHVHLVIVVSNPDDVCGFVRCFKTESAHMINRLLGRRKRTIWCEGYDSPIVLTLTRTILALSYLYINPVKDHLVETVEDYPGLSSWKMFQSGKTVKTWKRLLRSSIPCLTPDCHNSAGYSRVAERLMAESQSAHTFILEPDAWMDAFGVFDQDLRNYLNSSLAGHIATLEKREQKLRLRSGRSVIGINRLLQQTFHLTYISKRKGKRTVCLSDLKRIRVHFLSQIKHLFV